MSGTLKYGTDDSADDANQPPSDNRQANQSRAGS
jgi:hypothetical protein